MRFGGLRCPSEHLALRWGDIGWKKGLHHEGGDCRIVPLFPELRPHLNAVWDRPKSTGEFVITRYRDVKQNLRTQFTKIIERAGLNPWPRLFQNLRASRQTELCDVFPEHVVCAWLGNTDKVAREHYLHARETHYERGAVEPTVVYEPPKAPKAVHESGAREAIRGAQNRLSCDTPEGAEAAVTPENTAIIGDPQAVDEGPGSGRHWIRTSDLRGVNTAL